MASNTVENSKQVMVVAMDESDHSTYALEWTLSHFFIPYASNPVFKLVVVHAKPPPPAMALVGPGGVKVLPILEADLQKIAMRVVEKAKKICASKQVNDVVVELVAGDARNVLCEAVEKHKASILVSGSHGYGAIKRAVLGSVTDVVVEVVEGDARNVLCDAVERHHASILVVGSHGYGAIKRAVLGSVSDYCAHHAHSTVMIVKKPKTKH
ncbi:unnamed protein product [Malus baccata var. baccata]